MISTGAALSFGLICLAVGFVSGVFIACIACAVNPVFRTEWQNYRRAVESRKALREAMSRLDELLKKKEQA